MGFQEQVSKLIGYFYFFYFYVIISVAFFFAFLTQVCLLIVFFPWIFFVSGFRQTLLGGALQLFNYIAFSLCFFWRVEVVRPKTFTTPLRRTLVLCNHTSGLDSWVLLAVFNRSWPIFVIKRSLLFVPIAGWTLFVAGYPSVRFTSERGGWGTVKADIKKMMDDCKVLMECGHNILVYPEGTRSQTGRLQPFKNGFLKFAVENGYDILPMVAHNNDKLWPLKGFRMDAGTSYVAFGDIIKTQGLSVNELREKAQTDMFNLLRICPLFDEKTEQPLATMPPARGHGL